MNGDGPSRVAQRSRPRRRIRGNGGMFALKGARVQPRGRQIQISSQVRHPFGKTGSRRLGSSNLSMLREHTFILSVLFRLIASKGSGVETAWLPPYLPRITKTTLLIP